MLFVSVKFLNCKSLPTVSLRTLSNSFDVKMNAVTTFVIHLLVMATVRGSHPGSLARAPTIRIRLSEDRDADESPFTDDRATESSRVPTILACPNMSPLFPKGWDFDLKVQSYFQEHFGFGGVEYLVSKFSNGGKGVCERLRILGSKILHRLNTEAENILKT